MAGRSFFYFRDPAYAKGRGADFLSEDAKAAGKETSLKETIRRTCAAKRISLHEDCSDPRSLAGRFESGSTASIVTRLHMWSGSCMCTSISSRPGKLSSFDVELLLATTGRAICTESPGRR
jgi:hypothetical protein